MSNGDQAKHENRHFTISKRLVYEMVGLLADYYMGSADVVTTYMYMYQFNRGEGGGGGWGVQCMTTN